jgi:hypothetical protein
LRDRHGCMVVGFTTTCAISAYHHESCEFESRSWRGVLDITLRDNVCQCTPVSSTNTNTSDSYDIAELLLKVALSTLYYLVFLSNDIERS